MYTVNVMMSTYNGEKYLENQLDSILSQKNVSINLFIRDDGSTDGTHNILKKYNMLDNIHIFWGENIGWRKSFLWLLSHVDLNADFFCFSDQDDVWLLNKVFNGVDYIVQNDILKPWCYCCDLQSVDSNLNKIKVTYSKKIKYSNEIHCLINGYAMGCTIIFNKSLMNIIRIDALSSISGVSHDLLVSCIATYLGNIHRDSRADILYRLHGNNAGSRKRTFLDYYKVLFKSPLDWEARNLALYVYKQYYDVLADEQKSILRNFLHPKNINEFWRIITNKFFSRDTFKGTILIKWRYFLIFCSFLWGKKNDLK